MNTRNPKVRDTYRAEVWLNAAQVSFLDSLYPDQELALQVGLLVRDEMRASRRNVPTKPDPIASQGTVVALRPALVRPRPSNESGLPETSPKATTPPKKVAVAPLKAATPPKRVAESSNSSSAQTTPTQSSPVKSSPSTLSRPSLGKIHTDNPISQLQEICHKYQVRLPQYTFGHCEEGFSCECRVKVLRKNLATTGSGLNKKAAKRNATIEALRELGYS